MPRSLLGLAWPRRRGGRHPTASFWASFAQAPHAAPYRRTPRPRPQALVYDEDFDEFCRPYSIGEVPLKAKIKIKAGT